MELPPLGSWKEPHTQPQWWTKWCWFESWRPMSNCIQQIRSPNQLLIWMSWNHVGHLEVPNFLQNQNQPSIQSLTVCLAPESALCLWFP